MATATKSRRASSRRRAPDRAAPRDMAREDICNVEPVTDKEFVEFVSPLTGLTERLACSSRMRRPDPTTEEIAQRCEEVLAFRRANEAACLDTLDDDERDALGFELDDRWELVGEGDE